MGEAKRRYSARDGVVRSTHYDNDRPEDVVIETEMDVEPVLDSIHRDRELMPNNGYNKLVARLPVVVVEDLIRRGIYFDEDAFKVWLNSFEAQPWRIWQGSV